MDGLVSGVPVKTPVVRSTVSAATPVRPIVAIILIGRDLQTLPERKADKSRKDYQGQKRSYPIWHSLLPTRDTHHRVILKTLAHFRRDVAFALSLCSALIIAVRGTIGSPPCLPTNISHSIAVTQCGNPCSASGNYVMYSAASCSVTNGFRAIGSKNR
jgi:hypothetical protein